MNYLPLKHRAIPSVFDRGEWQGTGEPLYAMSYAPGETLESSVRRDAGGLLGKRLSLLEAADAVAHAHERGVMHRNLGPGNIVVAGGTSTVLGWSAVKYQRPKADEDAILDAAELADGGPNQAAAGAPGFAAPEQSSPWHDYRVDIFALGATLEFILSGGSQPGAGPGLEPPSYVVRGPARLASIVGKAKATDPNERYSSVREFAFDLRRLLSCQWVVPQGGKD